MHFHFTNHTKNQLDIANTTHNVYQIVLHLPNCASPKIRGSVLSTRICWWQKREQSITAFFSIKTKAYFFKNDTSLSTKQHVTFWKRHVTFNKSHLLLNARHKMAHIKYLVIKRKKNKLFPLHTRAYARIYGHITGVLSFLLSHLSHLFTQNS